MHTNVYQVTIVPQIDSIFVDITPIRFELKLDSDLQESEIRQELESVIQVHLGDFCASIDWTDDSLTEATITEYYLIVEVKIVNNVEDEQ